MADQPEQNVGRALREAALSPSATEPVPVSAHAGDGQPREIVEAFRAWLAGKPADEEYNFFACGHCAFAQFLRDTGIARYPRCGGLTWTDGRKSKRHNIPEALIGGILSGEPYTFGALRKRLDERLAA